MYTVEYRIVGKHRKWRKVPLTLPVTDAQEFVNKSADYVRSNIAENSQVPWHQVKLRLVKQ